MSVDLREECSCAAVFQVSGEMTLADALSAVEDWREEHRHGEPRRGPVDQTGALLGQAEEQGQPTLGFRGAS